MLGLGPSLVNIKIYSGHWRLGIVRILAGRYHYHNLPNVDMCYAFSFCFITNTRESSRLKNAWPKQQDKIP